MILQPSDWTEQDVDGKYTIQVFGRTETKRVVCVRITGFTPYFYTATKPNLTAIYEASNKKDDKGNYKFRYSKFIREHPAPTLEKVKKYDVMEGFQELKETEVWKVKCSSLASFRTAKSECKGVQYESNLPPLLRFFHERDIGPASAISCSETEEIEIPTTDDDPDYYVDAMYTCSASNLSASDAQIPMLVASYDLEMYSASGLFPVPSKDPIIQIGVSYRWSNAMGVPVDRVVFVLGSVSDSVEEGIEFVSCRTEESLLNTFADEIITKNPDILCGYNIFGFDDGYIEGRLKTLGMIDTWCVARKRNGFGEQTFETKKTELASGKYDLRYLTIRGRLGIDLLLNMRREHSLDSFKLDSVASVFLRNKVLGVEDQWISTKRTRGLRVGNYVRFETVGNTNDPYFDGHKFKVIAVEAKRFQLEESFDDIPSNLEWTFTKDDVEPHELFRLHREGGPEGRARIANYCIQDCDLVTTLMETLDTIVNARGMSDVCKVPLQYVLTRGQGIKIFSAVVYYAAQRNQIIRVQENAGGDGIGYEGAIVLPPKIGMYLDQPISVLDFNSLYPTNMISYNLSPDTLVGIRTYDEENTMTSCEGCTKEERVRLQEKGYVLEDISYDTKEGDVVTGKTVCTWVQPNDNPLTVGILPKTLAILLQKRKEFKQKMEDPAYEEAQRSVFNGLQLAYKVVANSVYGQAGSRTSPIRRLCVAACTTAVGRMQLYNAKQIVESEFGATVIYGDSVASYTPVLVRVDNDVQIVSIEELGHGKHWKQMENGKEFCELENTQSWTETGWTALYRIIRHQLAPTKKMIRVVTHSGLVDVTDDHSLIRSNGLPVSPKDAKVGDELLHAEFPMEKLLNSTHSSPSKTQVDFAKSVYNFKRMFGIDVDVDVSWWSSTLYSKIRMVPVAESTKHTIKKMYPIQYSGYVYDLTTENHHFQAGVGRLIVHNTDSIFVQFPEKRLVDCIKTAIAAGNSITRQCRKPYKIAYEKTFFPFILFCRKRYVGMKYEEDPNPASAKRVSMGIVLKRRDNAPIVKDVFGGALDILLQERNVPTAQTFVTGMLTEILENKFPMEKYVISKSLRDDYKLPEQIAHAVLAERMKKRDPGTAPKVGDRIQYMFVANRKDEKKQGDRIEHIDYVRAKGLVPDTSFYITNQIQNPVAQLFALCIEQMTGYVAPRPGYASLYEEKLEKHKGDEEEATLSVLAAKERQLETLLFLKSPRLANLVRAKIRGPLDAYVTRSK